MEEDVKTKTVKTNPKLQVDKQILEEIAYHPFKKHPDFRDGYFLCIYIREVK